MGSVKDLEILIKPTENHLGVGKFVFSDDYSVFDFGKMPDPIPGKGSALCLMGAYFFEKLEEKGMKTHYRGLVDNNGKIVSLGELKEPTNRMEVNLVRKIYPEFCDGRYDYSMFTSDLVNYLIPLEVIYRNELPNGSSVFRRLKRHEITYKDLGLDHYPKPGEKLKTPILDVSTKLEKKDRYFNNWNEAQKIAGLKDIEVENIQKTLLYVNDIITKTGKKAKLVNQDGKIELAFGLERELMLVDVLGTLDESRFSYKGTDVSKEVAREFYRNTPWYIEIEEAKKSAKEYEIEDWRELCKSKPPVLDPTLKEIISEMYTSVANGFLSQKIFDSPSIEVVVRKYNEWLINSI